MEIVAFLFFKGQSEALFYLVIGLPCYTEEPKAHQAQSAVTQRTVHIQHFPPPTGFCHITFYLFTKCHFLQPHFCVNITGDCTSCTSSFLYLTARLPLDFWLIKYSENIRHGKRECLELKATVLI